MTRAALIAGTLMLIGFVVLVAVALHNAAVLLVAALALVILIGAGNLLYGKNSHGAMAKARVRPAQEAQNRAIDEARRQARHQHGEDAGR